MKPESLYVHVPFCLRRCGYCDFAVTATRRPPLTSWLDAIEAELRGALARHGWEGLRLRTLYVGGGTPSTLGVGAMAELRRRLARHVDLAGDVEWTVEANPESFDASLAADWRRAGVGRVSLGVQSFDEATLRWMGRLHGAEGPARAVAAGRAAGIASISLDLIFGLPERLPRDWRGDVERLLSLDPDHVSLYGLTAEPATPLGRSVREGREAMPAEERYGAEYLEAAARLEGAGFEHYEVSNFARPGQRSRHNAAYWDGSPYLGLGPGAHSFVPPRRWWNTRDWAAYRGRALKGGDAVEGTESLDEEASRLEHAWLGLRTREGVARAEWPAAEASLLPMWLERGWAHRDGSRIRLTPAGWLLLDRLSVELAECGRRGALDARSGGAAHSFRRREERE